MPPLKFTAANAGVAALKFTAPPLMCSGPVPKLVIGVLKFAVAPLKTDDIGGTVAVTEGTLVVAANLNAGALAIADGATVILSSTGAALAGNAFRENLDAPFNESATAAVPEPGSAALLFGGALALPGVRRRFQF